MKKRNSRLWITLIAVAMIGAALAWSFWPRALMVDMARVERAAMITTINEEGKTRVRNAYVVSTPVAGRLLRIDVVSGDEVERGKSVIARMLPSNPSALDVRTREQARAAVTAAEAAVRVARADLNKAKADAELADLDLNRKRTLHKSGIESQAAVERAQQAWRASNASLEQAKAGISMRQADLANSRARLIDFSETSSHQSVENITQQDAIPLLAPISGRILRVLQESETTLPAGKAIIEIGDISNDLEIVTELLSTDAVRVSEGNRVIIKNWGGEHDLNGLVERVDPWGFTKFSALGVEEQRVHAVIKFTDPPARRINLGHGFRVETRIVTWEDDDALVIPSSALFRHNGAKNGTKNGKWAAYVVEDDRIALKSLKIGHNNGIQAEVLGGLEAGNQVVLFPGSGLADGVRVKERNVN